MTGFRYADEGDALTGKLISQEYDEAYWGKSEELVLAGVDAFIREQLGEGRLAHARLLDAGCGMGRLIPHFAGMVGEVVAFDPDAQRAGAAMELVREQGIANAQVSSCDMATCLAAEVGEGAGPFDVVLFSHIFQHIPHAATDELLRMAWSCLAPGGVLVVTTTYCEGRDNQYMVESFVEGERVVRPLDVAGFEQVMGRVGELPVCRFSEAWMRDRLSAAGFDARRFGRFHYAREHEAANDAVNNADRSRDVDARDAFYLCVKGGGSGAGLADVRDDLVASGKICYMQYYALDSRAITDATVKRAEELAAADGEAAQIMADFATAEGFLYGGGLHFPTQRYAFAGRHMAIRDIPVTSSFVVVSLYAQTGVCQIDVCFTVGVMPVSDWVFMRQIQGARGVKFSLDALQGDAVFAPGRGGDANAFPLHLQMSVPDLCDQILADLNLTPIGSSSAYLAEINSMGACTKPTDLSAEQEAALYGVLTGDEGWRYVPSSHIEERLSSSWSTREFVKAIAFGNNFLLLNFNRSSLVEDYESFQRSNGERYYGGVNDYFLMDADTAGVNHGLFFSVETGMLMKVIGNRLLAVRPSEMDGKAWFLTGEMGRSKRYRGELISTLGKLENMGISEMGDLDGLVIRSLDVEERVRSIRELLELVESELDLVYQTNTNRMVTLLTIIGLLFGALEVFLSLPMFSS